MQFTVFIIIEILKYRYIQGKRNNLNFYRNSSGNEIDLIYNIAQYKLPIEIKSSQTVISDFFKGFKTFDKVVPELFYGKVVIYGGDKYETRGDIKIITLTDIEELLDEIK